MYVLAKKVIIWSYKTWSAETGLEWRCRALCITDFDSDHPVTVTQKLACSTCMEKHHEPRMNALHGWKQTCLGINMDKESSSWTFFVSWKLFCIVTTHHDHHASIVPTISNLMGFGWVKACIRSSSCFPHQTLGAISAWFDPWPQAWDEFKVEMPTWKRAWCWPSVDILKWTEGHLTRVWFHSKTGK